MRTLILLIFLSSLKNIHGQEVDYSTFKQHVFGVALGIGLDDGHSKSFKYTYRIKPQFGVSLEYLRTKEAGMTSEEGTKHLHFSAKFNTKATRRFQLFLSPHVGLGFYEPSDYDLTVREKLLDFGLSGGFDIHILNRLIFTYAVHYQSNIVIDNFYYSNIGLAIKL